MTPRLLASLSDLCQSAWRFLLRLYLFPLKKILFMSPPAQSFRSAIRTELKRKLVGNPALLTRILEPDVPELRVALCHNNMRILSRLLAGDDFNLLVDFLNNSGNTLFDAMQRFFSSNPELLNRLLLNDNAARLKTLLAPDSPVLSDLMTENEAERLKVLLKPNSDLLFDLMTENGAERLKVLLKPNSNLLFDLMAENEAVRLHEVLSKNNHALTKKLFSARSPLFDEVVGLNRHILLRQYLFENDYEALVQVLDYDKKGVYPRLFLKDNSPLMDWLLSRHGSKLLRDILFKKELMRVIAQEPGARLWCEFEIQWEAIKKWLPENDPALEERRVANRSMLRANKPLRDCLADTFCHNGELRLRHGTLRLADPGALMTLLTEILVNEDYYADLSGSPPRIIDCGAHQGMSLYYFKTCCPDARITAFEPDPDNLAIASENMRRNNFTGVEILPFALAAQEGSRTFRRYKGQSMAGSLVNRDAQLTGDPDEVTPVEVRCVRLSDYLQEPVDYLKLDIEGAEEEVLRECAAHLYRVHYLFCEYHHMPELPGNSLIRILELLDGAGFDLQVAKAYNSGRRSQHRPMQHVGARYSAVIFAKNRCFQTQPTKHLAMVFPSDNA